MAYRLAPSLSATYIQLSLNKRVITSFKNQSYSLGANTKQKDFTFNKNVYKTVFIIIIYTYKPI
jgi:hypothetical protein